jgi:hypothetical protein
MAISPITYAELKRRAASGDLSPEELAAYFLPDPAHHTAFVPAVRLNRDLVDLDGVEPRRRFLLKLLLRAEEAWSTRHPLVQQSGPDATKKSKSFKKASARVRVLAEGDSWFRLPDSVFLGYPKDAVDILRLTHDVNTVAFYGDEIAEMVSDANKKNYLVPLNAGLRKHFIFSGGGNDVLGSIATYVKKMGSTGTDPASPASYVHPDFDKKLDETLGHYKTLYGHVRGSSSPDIPLYLHGYAYAIPRQNGPYIGGVLKKLGFEPGSQLAKAIVREMVNRFNVRLKAFADARATVRYVDLRLELGASDWHTDEIHPNDSGARKVARRLREAIAGTIPTV